MRLRLPPKHWIPPIPLAGSLVLQVAAWVVVLAYAARPAPELALAWIHAVGLGWLSIVAVTVLLHVIPAFTDLPWRGERIVRAAVPIALVGSAGLVASFAAGAPHALEAAAGIIAIAIVAYVACATATLAQPAEDRTTAAIARALTVTLLALAIAVLLGASLAGAYASGNAAILALAPSHALLAIGAWLSVLVLGVSARTFRPMLGARTRWPLAHVVAGTSVFTGSIIAAIGVPSSLAIARAGIALAIVGALVYAADAFDIVRRATTPHPPVRAFVFCAVLWLLVAAVCTAGAACGAPLGAFAVVAALGGWIGQMVNAHLHHIGVRVVITLLRGDEDETRPWDVLDVRATWTAFALAQCAVLGLLAGLASGAGWALAAGGACGLGSIAAMALNLRCVRRNTAALPIVLG